MAEPKTVSREVLVGALRAIAMADKTAYEHHEPRQRDRKLPEAEGATIWMTPREVALRVLEAMGEETESPPFFPFTPYCRLLARPAKEGVDG